MAEVVYLSNVRLSFPHLAEPHSSGQGAPAKYSADFIMEPNDPNYAKFMEQVSKAALEKWGEHAGQVLQMINADRRLRCYGAGEEVVNKKTFQVYDGYAGKVRIGASRDQQPQMIKPDGTSVDSMNTMEYQAFARKMYGGCYVNVALRPWTQDNQHGRGIRCDLVAIQFNADGEAFGEGATDASGMFGTAAQTTSPAAQPQATAPAMPAAPYPDASQQAGTPAIPGMPPFMQ